MRILISLAALAATLAPAHAYFASDWWRVSTTDAATIYIDLQTVRTNGQWTVATEKMVYTTPSAETKVKVATVLIEFDCRARQSRYQHFWAHDSAGGQVADMNQPDGLEAHAVDSGSAAEQVYNFVCNVNRKNAVRVADPLAGR